MEAGISKAPVAIHIGASSPTLVLEPDSPIKTGNQTDISSQIVAEEEPLVKFTTGDGGEEEEKDGEEVGEGGEDVTGAEGGEGEGLVGEDEGTILESVDVTQQEGGVIVGEEREGGGEEVEMQAGSIMQSMETITGMNFDLPEAPPQSHSSTPTSPLLPTTMETVALGTQEVIEEEETMREEEMGEPLQLQEELSAVGGTPLQLNEPPKTEEEEEMNTVGGLQLEQGGHQLEVNELQLKDPAGDGAHLLDVREAGVGPLSTSTLPPPAVEVSSPPSAIPTHLSDPLISLPSPSPKLPPSHLHRDGREDFGTREGEGGGGGDGERGDIGPEPRVIPPVSSPYPEEVAGVKEALYTAWIPSPWTLDLLSRQTPVDQSHLTCPGLVADIKMVRYNFVVTAFTECFPYYICVHLCTYL